MDRFDTKKSLGQHFLNSAVVPKWLAEAADIKEGDMVVEVGPGTGALTTALLSRGAKVIALEADKRAIEVLKERFATLISTGQLDVRHADARELDLNTLSVKDHQYKVVANIPYYLTGHLFRLFLESTIQPSLLVFLVQKEVGKRATSQLDRGEKESLLSLSLKAFGRPKYVKAVGKGHFTPPPKVDSAIVAVENISRERFQDLSPEKFFTLLHLGFGAKRKQLLGNLAKNYDRERVAEILTSLQLPLDVRAEDIDIEKWIILAKQLG